MLKVGPERKETPDRSSTIQGPLRLLACVWGTHREERQCLHGTTDWLVKAVTSAPSSFCASAVERSRPTARLGTFLMKLAGSSCASIKSLASAARDALILASMSECARSMNTPSVVTIQKWCTI